MMCAPAHMKLPAELCACVHGYIIACLARDVRACIMTEVIPVTY